MGCPSASSLFNQTIDRLLDGSSPFPIPHYFAIHLETSRFLNRVSRTMAASLEETQGVSHHMVIHLEEEFAKVQRLLYPENSGDYPL
jgi:transcriptional regulatory protein LEU3